MSFGRSPSPLSNFRASFWLNLSSSNDLEELTHTVGRRPHQAKEVRLSITKEPTQSLWLVVYGALHNTHMGLSVPEILTSEAPCALA